MATVKPVRLGDLPAGHDGNGYITVEGEVYPALKISKLTPKSEMILDTKRFLEERVEQNAARGTKHSFDLDYYMASSALLEAVQAYEQGGAYPDITLQYYVDTPAYGRQEVLLTGVILESVGMGALDDGSDSAQVHSTSGSYADFQIISRFH